MTRVRQCYVSLKKPHPSDETRISRLLEREKARKQAHFRLFWTRSIMGMRIEPRSVANVTADFLPTGIPEELEMSRLLPDQS